MSAKICQKFLYCDLTLVGSEEFPLYDNNYNEFLIQPNHNLATLNVSSSQPRSREFTQLVR